MYLTKLRNLFYLHRIKVKVLLLFLFALPYIARAQEGFQYNLPYSDSKWLHYGFSIGLHSSSFKIKYSERFISNDLDTVHSIMPANAFGFSLGFITDFRLADQFNVRILPKVSFYEFPVEFNYTSQTTDLQLIEATFVEVPVLLKYKSERYKNFRVYVVGGVAPGFEVSGKKRKAQSDNKLLATEFNVNLELGIGIDMYYPLFKFSPEIRFSKGLLNMLKPDKYGYSEGIESMNMNVVSLFFQFSD